MEGPFLDEDNAAFVQRGISIVAASRDATLMPSIARATGCVVSPDRRRVTIFAIESQAQQLLADVRASGRIAVVFSQPTTHRTLQLKAEDARIRPLRGEERAVVAAYVDAFAIEIGRLGHTGAQAHIMFEC